MNGSNPATVLNYGFSNAYFIHVDNNNNIYFSSTLNNAVFLFPVNSTTSTMVAGNGTQGINNNELNAPYGIFVNDVGSIYVADCGNNRVMKWLSGATSGVIVAGNGIAGNSSTQLDCPMQIIVDMNEYIYISDGSNSRITRWAPNSTFGVCIAACSGTAGSTSTQLNIPYSLAFDSNGSLYVSDLANNRIQKFQILQYYSEYLINE